MKKKLSRLLSLVLAMMMALSISALAENIETDKMTIEGLNGVVVELSGTSDEKILVSYAAEDLEGQFLIMMVTAADGVMNTPGANTILYIDQVAAEDGEISFEVYPSAMQDSIIMIYGLIPDGNGGTVKQLKAAIVEAKYILGDVNGDGKINLPDAVLILKHIAKLTALEGTDYQAANVDGNASIGLPDAVLVLKMVAGLISEF